METNVKVLLSYLSYVDAKTLWEYLDSDPDAVTDMIEYIAETHPDLANDLCGVDETLNKKAVEYDGPLGYKPEIIYPKYGYTGPDETFKYTDEVQSIPCDCRFCKPPIVEPEVEPKQSWLQKLWFGFWFWLDNQIKGI